MRATGSEELKIIDCLIGNSISFINIIIVQVVLGVNYLIKTYWRYVSIVTTQVEKLIKLNCISTNKVKEKFRSKQTGFLSTDWFGNLFLNDFFCRIAVLCPLCVKADIGKKENCEINVQNAPIVAHRQTVKNMKQFDYWRQSVWHIPITYLVDV